MTTTHNYSILSNWAIENWERLYEKKKKILDSIKMDLLETLKEDNVVNRNILADKLTPYMAKLHIDGMVGVELLKAWAISQ